MLGKARGMAGAYVALFKLIEEQGGIDEAEPCFVGYTGSRAQAAPFVRFVTQNLGLEKPPVMPIGTVIGTHRRPWRRRHRLFGKRGLTALFPSSSAYAAPSLENGGAAYALFYFYTRFFLRYAYKAAQSCLSSAPYRNLLSSP